MLRAVAAKAGAPGASTSVFFYRADTQSQAPNDPGTGRLRWNNSDQHAATALYVDRLTNDGFDSMLFFSLASIGDRFVLQDADLAVSYQLWEKTGPAIDHMDWFEVPVRFVASAGVGVFSNNAGLAVLLKSGAAGINWRGAYDTAANYEPDDGVLFNGSSYIALLASTGVNPGSDANTWDLLAQRGQDGASGQNGLPGAPGYSPNTLLYGGGVAWIGGLNYRVSAASYVIANVTYSSPETTVALGAADALLDRLDLIVANAAGAVVVLAGTPSSTPELPDVDPATQLQLSFAYVPAAAVAPADTTTTDIFHEGTEWTPSKSGAPINLASTSNPHAGTKCIEATVAVTNNFFQFASVIPVELAKSNSLVFYIRSKAAWPSSRSLSLRWQTGNTPKGVSVTLRDGTFGFESSLAGVYQQIVIPLPLFGADGLGTDRLRFTVAGSGAGIGFHVDDATLQGGVTQSGTGSSALVWRGAWNDKTAYTRNDVVQRGGGTYVALLPNTNDEPTTGGVGYATVDGYSELNLDDFGSAVGGPYATRRGQSFTPSMSGDLASARFSLARTDVSVTGTAVAKLYSHSGTYGVSSVGNVLLATSDPFNVAALSTLYAQPTIATFVFSGAQRVPLVAGTHYVIVMEFTGGDASHYLYFDTDSSAPTHGGNHMWGVGAAWTAVPTADAAFYVNIGATWAALASPDITGNAATATKLQTARTIGGFAFDGSADILQPLDVSVFYPGAPTASAIVARVPIARYVSLFQPNFAGSYGIANVAATASTAFDIRKNAGSIGTMTFAAGATAATFVSAGGAAQQFAAGDILSIIAPVAPDVTLADIGITLAGVR